MATFGKALTNIVKCDPDDGFVYPHKYYDFTHLFEEMKLKLFSRCLKISVREFMSDKELYRQKVNSVVSCPFRYKSLQIRSKIKRNNKGERTF